MATVSFIVGPLDLLARFGAVLTHLAQGNPSPRRKANPEQAPVCRGASKPSGRMLHDQSCDIRVSAARRQVVFAGHDFLASLGFEIQPGAFGNLAAGLRSGLV